MSNFKNKTMSKKCDLTGKGVMFGNNVSHAHNKTRRKFLPNLQNISLMSDILQKTFRFRISSSGLRTVESKGGLDEYLLNVCECKLSKKAKIVKEQILKSKNSVTKGVM